MVTDLPAPGPRQNTILLVEDDPELAELFSVTLQQAGFAVDAVLNGRDAVEYLNQAVPDLILSDLMMPEMNGMEFLARVRADPAWHFIPFILLTTQAATEHVVAGFELGADDYIIKPVNARELLARVRSKIMRPPIPLETLRRDRQTGLLSEVAFNQALQTELTRARRGDYPCTLVKIKIYESAALRDFFGPRADAALALSIGQILKVWATPLETLGRGKDGSFMILCPETSASAMGSRLEILNRSIVRNDFVVGAETFRVTPICGYADVGSSETGDDLKKKASTALDHAFAHLDLRPICYEPDMALAAKGQGGLFARLKAQLEPLRLPMQIMVTYVIGWVLPFLIYAWSDAAGFDITLLVYWIVVVVLLLTAGLIWIEGFLSLRRIDPPEVPEDSYGPVSAIIAAYLPNEAPTLEATIREFLKMDYPAEFQLILAYNTPFDMPIEERLRQLSLEDPRFVPLRVDGSTSKAQNVNAAISIVTTPVVGIYDADHHPDPDSFRRAWRWIANGADVVQGHCLIRNGDASWVGRMVAVEFELIYSVNHPGRDRLHKFAIFGGSNGFWRTDILREVRMRGSMLTEDIDSSMRAVQAGYKIVSDAYLVSRELAPTSLKALTNQRLRWAQGWYQVAKHQMTPALRTPKLSFRQKMGMVHLLAWREVFPWISIQIVPIVVYWMWRAGSVHSVDWFVPLLVIFTLFIFVTGPGQLIFAWRQADPQIKKRTWWFWNYLLMSILFYSGYKNILARVANLKEFLGEKSWRVTPRS